MADEKILETISQKLDGVAHDVRTHGFQMEKQEVRMDRLEVRMDRIEVRFDRSDENMATLLGGLNDLTKEVRTLSKQFGGVMDKVFENEDRLETVEKRVGVLEAGTN